MLAATTLPRTRHKETGSRTYDLRPLLGSIVVRRADPPIELGIRTMFHADRGAGRPDEVLLALGDALGRELEATSIVRERLVLRDDPDLEPG
jgi:hypothetical protein